MADDRDPSAVTRRDLLKIGATVVAGAAALDSACAPVTLPGKPPSGPPAQYDVIIIGTGFGASVAAMELATACPKAKILMLEKGSYFTSPDRPVPDYFTDTSQSYQTWPVPDNDHGFRTAFLNLVRTNLGRPTFRASAGKVPLYQYSMFDDVDILTGSGVGGGSLVYSNVSIVPYFDGSAFPVMADWPLKLDTPAYDAAKTWMDAFRTVRNYVVTTAPLPKELKPFVTDLENAKPDPMQPAVDYSYLYLPRSKALRDASRNLTDPQNRWSVKDPWAPLELQVTDHGGTDPKDLKNSRFCERQGRCFLGCLPGARHTLYKSLIKKLLTDAAHKNFVSVKPLMHVQDIRQVGTAEYEVAHHHVISGDEFRSRAPLVILSAGVIGSTEILLHAQENSALTLSAALGSRFSTNGDFSGFVRNIPTFLGDHPRRDNRVLPTRGPINTSHVHFEANWNGHKLHINVEDAGVPPMFARVTRVILDSMKDGQLSFGRFLDRVTNFADKNKTEHELVEDVFWFNCMGTDGKPGTSFADAGGRFRLDRGKLRLDYKEGNRPTDHPVFQLTESIMQAMAVKMQGEYVPFPLAAGLFGRKKVVTTHPLGGCPMGQTAADGVVDTQGRVFKGQSGSDVYAGLYVMDGSILPGAVAVNPTLTIVAMSLKIVESAKQFLKTAKPELCS
jgi:cholesterol oxidase